MKPTYLTMVADLDGKIVLPDVTKAGLHRLFNVPGIPNSSAMWNGHEFEVGSFYVPNDAPNSEGEWTVTLYDFGQDHVRRVPSENVVHLYYPVDPVIVEKDVRGAVEAYANPDNTAWLFRHCGNKHMLDREVEIGSAVVRAFAPGIDKLQQACNLQLRLYARNPSDTSAGSREQAARLKHAKLIEFRNKVLAHCETEARKRHLGWYHQNPDESHIHHIVHDAVTTLYHANKSDYGVVQAEIMRAAFTVHTYETRWDQAARLKREAAEREAAAGD